MELQKNENQSQKIYSFCLLIAMVGLFLIFVGHPNEKEQFISSGTWLIILSSALGFFSLFVERFSTEINFMLPLISLALCSTISLALAKAFSYENFVTLLCYLEIPFFVSFISEVRMRGIKKYIYLIFYVLSCYFVYLSKSDVAYQFETFYGKTNVESLTLGYNNPNETGMYLFICLIVLISGFYYFKKITTKVLFLLNSVLITDLVFKTESRAAIVVSVCTVASLLFLNKIKKIEKIAQYITLVPLMWAIVVILFNDTISKIDFMGESIETGRLSIYLRPFKNMDFISFFFGNYIEFNFENLHNTYITIFATTGIIGIITFFVFKRKKITSLSECFSTFDMSERVAFWGIIMVILHSAVESAILVSGSAFAVIFVVLYVLAFSNIEDRGEYD